MQSLDVLLLALCAIQRLREAASVLRGCRELSDLAVNLAVERAESWALTLSSLTVSLEFPPYDPGCGSEGYSNTQGAAAAMPLAQVRLMNTGVRICVSFCAGLLDVWRHCCCIRGCK